MSVISLSVRPPHPLNLLPAGSLVTALLARGPSSCHRSAVNYSSLIFSDVTVNGLMSVGFRH